MLAAAVLALATAAKAEPCISAPAWIKIYVTDWCPFCKALIRYLHNRGIYNYSLCDIEEDYRCAEELLALTGTPGVPVTYVCNYRISGFDQLELDRVFGPGRF